MKKFIKLLSMNKVKMKLSIISIALITGFIISMFIYKNANAGNPVIFMLNDEKYNYNDSEKLLAENIKVYLSGYLDINEKSMGKISDEAVQNYKTIMQSDVTEVNFEHSAAITFNMMKKIAEYCDAKSLEIYDIDALASGCTEIIWKAVLKELESNENTELIAMDKRYSGLIDSLQTQVDDLSEKKTKINLSIKNQDTVITESSIAEMTDKEIEALSKKLGISEAEISKKMASSISGSREVERELANIRNSVKNGKDGATGAKGDKGATGATGATGKAGTDGKSTFIMYSVYENGRDSSGKAAFSNTPSNETKYIGIANVVASSAPTDPGAYMWTAYKDRTISYTNEGGKPTLVIN